jgi:hypothetical protein
MVLRMKCAMIDRVNLTGYVSVSWPHSFTDTCHLPRLEVRWQGALERKICTSRTCLHPYLQSACSHTDHSLPNSAQVLSDRVTSYTSPHANPPSAALNLLPSLHLHSHPSAPTLNNSILLHHPSSSSKHKRPN